MHILILDDVKYRHDAYDRLYEGHAVEHVYTYSACIEKLLERVWDLVHLDHDLGDFLPDGTAADTYVDGWGKTCEYNGQHVAMRICELAAEKRPKSVIIHSINGPGGQAMQQLLARVEVPVRREPFGDFSED